MNLKLLSLLSFGLFALGLGATTPSRAALTCDACDVAYEACVLHHPQSYCTTQLTSCYRHCQH